MSVELRMNQHDLVCDWGVLDNTSADPMRKGGPRHLVLITPEHAQLLQFQPHIGPYGDVDTATAVDERVFRGRGRCRPRTGLTRRVSRR